MSIKVGYLLVEVGNPANVIQTWGGTPGQIPPIPAEIRLPDGTMVHAPALNTDYGGFMLVEWFSDEPPISRFDAPEWMLRFTNAEYAATMEATDVTIRRYWDAMLSLGYVDVKGATAVAAKQHWIDEGLLTQARADIIWDTVPSSIPPPP